MCIRDSLGSVHLLEGIDENGEIRPEAEEAVMEELKGNFRPEFLDVYKRQDCRCIGDSTVFLFPGADYPPVYF